MGELRNLLKKATPWQQRSEQSWLSEREEEGLHQHVPFPRDQEVPGGDQGAAAVPGGIQGVTHDPAAEQEEGGAGGGHPQGGGGAHGEQDPPDRGGDQGGGQGGGHGLRGEEAAEALAGRARLALLPTGLPPDPICW